MNTTTAVCCRLLPMLAILLMDAHAQTPGGFHDTVGAGGGQRRGPQRVTVSAQSGAKPYTVSDGIVLMEGDGSTTPFDNPWPLAKRTALHFLPNDQNSFRVEPAAFLPEASIGDPLGGEIGSALNVVRVDIGFGFPMAGTKYSSAWVSPHGCIFFEEPSNTIPIPIAKGRPGTIGDSSPRLCPAYASNVSWPKNFRRTADRAVFSWGGGPEGGFQVVLTPGGEAYFYYAIALDQGAVLAITGKEAWWSGNRVLGEAVLPDGRLQLTQMGDTNMVALNAEFRNPSTVAGIAFNVFTGTTEITSLGSLGVYINGQTRQVFTDWDSGGWDTLMTEDGGNFALLTPVPVEMAGQTVRSSVTVFRQVGQSDAVNISFRLPSAVQEITADFGHSPATGSQVPLMNAYRRAGVMTRAVASRAPDCGPSVCDALVIYNSFPNVPVSPNSGRGNMQVKGIGQGDPSQPFETNIIYMSGFPASSDDGHTGSSYTLSHEFGHGWLDYFSIMEGGQKMHSLNPDAAHPAAYVHAPAAFPQVPGAIESSVMGGGAWVENADGSFTNQASSPTGYSWLELYLMGLADATEVPDWFYLRNTNPPQPSSYSATAGAHVTGEKVPVSIRQLIAAEGPRQPAYGTSKKDFAVQFLVLYRRGEPLTPEQLTVMHNTRLQWQAMWERSVGGRARLRTSVSPPTASGPAVRMEVYSGNSQVAVQGYYVPNPLVAVAIDAAGNRVAGANVVWTVKTGDAVVHPVGTTTDEIGRAVATLEVRSSRVEVAAGISGGPSAVFDARSGPFQSRILSGDNQTGVAGKLFASPIVIELQDSAGQPVSGVPVQFSGNVSGLTATVTTDALGRASTSAAPLVPGPVTIFAELPDTSVLMVKATAVDPAAPVAVIVNAASSSCCGVVARGELVIIRGSGFGASRLARASYYGDGSLPREAGGTRVYFDGVPAPILYSLKGEVSAVVPDGIQGATAFVQVEQDGRMAAQASTGVTASVPGIFCESGNSGQAIATNTYADGRTALNRDEGAESGGWLTFFITGDGVQSPRLPIGVYVGGVKSECSGNSAEVIYSGVTQVRACVPAAAPKGAAVPLRVDIGQASSQSAVTVSIR